MGKHPQAAMSLQRQVLAKIASKRDPEREREAQGWIEEIVGEKFSVPLEEALRDGQVLCQLINKLAPGSVTKVNSTGAQFKMMENIQKFQNKREFSEDVLIAGKTVIGLQAGQNKGASQAGQNLGAGRKIILNK